MLSRTNLLILALALLAAIVGGWLQHESHLARAPVAGLTVANVGDLRPDLVLPDLQGRERHLSEFHGRRVLVNFWASWCVPCRAEMPALAAAQHKFGDQGVIVLGIAMDDPAHARAFLAAHPVDYPVLLGRLDFPSTSERFGDVDKVLPFSVLLDENGRVVATRRGPLDAAQLDAWLSPAAAP